MKSLFRNPIFWYTCITSSLLLATAAHGQNCADGVCLPSGAAVAAADPVDVECPKYSWHMANEHQYWLMKDNACVGQWYVPENRFYPFDGKNVLPSTHPPIDPPKKGIQASISDAMKKWCQNGVHTHKRTDVQHITLSGKKIADHQLAAAFSGTLDDDSAKGWFVIIAKDAAVRAQTEAEWAKLPADFRAKYLVWNMPPDHFSMQDRFSGKSRFTSEGDPTIILQNSNGEVLFRRPRAGLKLVSADFKDLLKADPNYQPALDPGVPAVPAKPVATPFSIPTWGWVTGGVLVLLLLRRK